MKSKLIIPVFLMVTLIFFLVSCQPTSKSSSPGGIVNFTLKNLEGKNVNLSDYRGKVVVLDFWATWCGPCINEIPTFTKIYKNFNGNKNFALITIVNESGDADDIIDFVNENGIQYPVVVGLPETVRYFGVPGYPTTFIIDKNGKIAQKFIGSQPSLYRLISKEVSKLIAS